MHNRKVITLIIVGTLAIISLIYGIFSPTRRGIKLSYRTVALVRDKNRMLAEKIGPARRHAKRSSYISLGKNPFLPSEVPAETILKLTLKGIVWDEENPKAIVNDTIVGIGDKIGTNTVVDIKKDRIVLNDGSSDIELKLRYEEQ